MLKIYLLSSGNENWDAFDSAVVVAHSDQEARFMNPAETRGHENSWPDCWSTDMWCNPDDVKIIEIGIANSDQQAGFVCTSFNAG